MRSKLNLVGQRFGKLLVLKEADRGKHGQRKWLCKCECGNECSPNGNHMVRGSTNSCGSCASFSLGVSSSCFQLYGNYKRGADRRGYEFNISMDTFKRLTKENCVYCGSPPSQVISKGYKHPYIYTGIDRKYNELGYIDNNIFPCCGDCNRWKSDMSYEDHQNHLDQIVMHSIKTKPHRYISRLQLAYFTP